MQYSQNGLDVGIIGQKLQIPQGLAFAVVRERRAPSGGSAIKMTSYADLMRTLMPFAKLCRAGPKITQ